MTDLKRLSGRDVARARRWAARLCLAEGETELRRVLSRAFLDFGFESIAAVERDSDHNLSILWRSMDGREVSLDEPLDDENHEVLAQLGNSVDRWAQQQDRTLTPAEYLASDYPDTGAVPHTDAVELPGAFGHSAWRTILSAPQRSGGGSVSIGVASVSSYEVHRQDIEIVRYFAHLYMTLQTSGLEDTGSAPPEQPELHPKQLECLRWAAAGKAYRDIADIVGISPRTVRFHLDAARTRYGYATITQAIVRAAKEFDFDPLDAR